MADDPRYPKLYAGERAAPEPSLAAEPPRDAVGTLLRRTREDFGQDLREVSEALRIRYAYLDAIERSAFEELPGPTYAIGFVRGYAQYLGLDDEEIVRRFKEESQGLKRDQELHFPAPVNEGKLPGTKILMVSLVLIAGAYGAWTYLSSDERSVAELVPQVPQRLQELVGAERQPAPPETPELAEAGDPAEPAGGTEKSGGSPENPDAATQPAAEQTAQRETSAGPDAEQTGTDDGPAASGSQTADGTRGSQTAADRPPESAAERARDADEAAGREVAGVPDAPAIPEAPENPEAGASGSAGEDAAATRAEPDVGAEGPAPQPPASEAAGTASEAEDAAEPAAGSEAPASDAPPAVPEMQQDQGGGPDAAGQTRTAAADTRPDGRSFGADAADSRITLRATARSWVQVRGPDDSLVLTRMLRPGDLYRVPDRPGLRLHTGNAGGLEAVVDGTSTGPLGERGEIRRGIVLEPDALGR